MWEAVQECAGARCPSPIGAQVALSGADKESAGEGAAGGAAPRDGRSIRLGTAERINSRSDRDMTPAEFNKFVDEILMVRAALARAR